MRRLPAETAAIVDGLATQPGPALERLAARGDATAQGSGLLQVASFHPSGFVRAEAVRLLAAEELAVALPCLLRGRPVRREALVGSWTRIPSWNGAQRFRPCVRERSTGSAWPRRRDADQSAGRAGGSRWVRVLGEIDQEVDKDSSWTRWQERKLGSSIHRTS
ncbi:MAG: hypothetical protein U1A78_17190 [Polyangia bacterium]